MKYVINILAAAILLAACTKTEVTYDSPSEIAFAPAAAVMTKAAYEGGDFNVFAYTEDGVPYFANEVFTDADNDGTYLGKSTQYWPNEKRLKFAGYTGAKKDVEVGTGLSTMTISEYDQSAGGDLMWFFTGAVSATVTDGEVTSITPVMHHACAKITINVKGEDACSSWGITQVEINDFHTSGEVTFTSGAANPTWTLSTTPPTTDTKLAFTAGATIGSEPSVSTIVIPQPPTTLSVTYNDKTVGDISLDYNSGAAWQAGYHYTYTLNFKNPYKIEFSVSGVDPWGEGGTITMQ